MVLLRRLLWAGVLFVVVFASDTELSQSDADDHISNESTEINLEADPDDAIHDETDESENNNDDDNDTQTQSETETTTETFETTKHTDAVADYFTDTETVETLDNSIGTTDIIDSLKDTNVNNDETNEEVSRITIDEVDDVSKDKGDANESEDKKTIVKTDKDKSGYLRLESKSTNEAYREEVGLYTNEEGRTTNIKKESINNGSQTSKDRQKGHKRDKWRLDGNYYVDDDGIYNKKRKHRKCKIYYDDDDDEISNNSNRHHDNDIDEVSSGNPDKKSGNEVNNRSDQRYFEDADYANSRNNLRKPNKKPGRDENANSKNSPGKPRKSSKFVSRLVKRPNPDNTSNDTDTLRKSREWLSEGTYQNDVNDEIGIGKPRNSRENSNSNSAKTTKRVLSPNDDDDRDKPSKQRKVKHRHRGKLQSQDGDNIYGKEKLQSSIKKSERLSQNNDVIERKEEQLRQYDDVNRQSDQGDDKVNSNDNSRNSGNDDKGSSNVADKLPPEKSDHVENDKNIKDKGNLKKSNKNPNNRLVRDDNDLDKDEEGQSTLRKKPSEPGQEEDSKNGNITEASNIDNILVGNPTHKLTLAKKQRKQPRQDDDGYSKGSIEKQGKRRKLHRNTNSKNAKTITKQNQTEPDNDKSLNRSQESTKAGESTQSKKGNESNEIKPTEYHTVEPWSDKTIHSIQRDSKSRSNSKKLGSDRENESKKSGAEGLTSENRKSPRRISNSGKSALKNLEYNQRSEYDTRRLSRDKLEAGLKENQSKISRKEIPIYQEREYQNKRLRKENLGLEDREFLYGDGLRLENKEFLHRLDIERSRHYDLQRPVVNSGPPEDRENEQRRADRLRFRSEYELSRLPSKYREIEHSRISESGRLGSENREYKQNTDRQSFGSEFEHLRRDKTGPEFKDLEYTRKPEILGNDRETQWRKLNNARLVSDNIKLYDPIAYSRRPYTGETQNDLRYRNQPPI